MRKFGLLLIFVFLFAFSSCEDPEQTESFNFDDLWNDASDSVSSAIVTSGNSETELSSGESLDESQESSSSQKSTSSQKQTVRKVYRTPSGKKYHFISTCGGKNSYEISFDQIGTLEPCKKCAND